MKKDLERFLKNLRMAAKLANFELDQDIVQLYDHALAPLGYDVAADAIMRLLETMPTGTRTILGIGAIKAEALGLGASGKDADDGMGRDVGNSIMRCVRFHGRITDSGSAVTTKLQTIRDDMGDVAWQVMLEVHGNWQATCETLTNDNMPNFMAQYRETTKTVLDRRRKGLPAPPPIRALPDPGSERPGQSSRFSVGAFARSYFEPRESGDKLH